MEKTTPLEFSEKNCFSFSNFEEFLKEKFYIIRTNWIKSIDFLLKKQFFEDFLKLLEQKAHTNFTKDKYILQRKKYLKQKRTLELNTRVELDLQQEKEALKELTRMNRPFLSVGKTTAKNSKHIICISRKKQKKQKDTIEDQTQSLELQLNLSQSIFHKNLALFTFQTFKFVVFFNKKRKSLITSGLKKSCFSIIFYTFSAWIGYTKLKKDKKQCIKIATEALQISKVYRILCCWKYHSSKPKRMKVFHANIQEFFRIRKLSRLFISWKWFCSNKKLNDCMNILANKFFREKLKAIKFFGLRTEVSLIVGSRKRYQELAVGDDNKFNKEEVLLVQKFGLRNCLTKIVQGLSRYRQEIFLLAQETNKVEALIASAQFYDKSACSWKLWLQKIYKQT